MEELYRRLKDNEEYTAKLDTFIRGDGNGIKGLLTRMIQVETYLANQKWWFRTIVGLFLGDIIIRVIALIKR